MAESRRYALTPQLGEDLIDLPSFFGGILVIFLLDVEWILDRVSVYYLRLSEMIV